MESSGLTYLNASECKTRPYQKSILETSNSKTENVNFIQIDDKDVPPAIKAAFANMIAKNCRAFADTEKPYHKT